MTNTSRSEHNEETNSISGIYIIDQDFLDCDNAYDSALCLEVTDIEYNTIVDKFIDQYLPLNFN